MKNNELIILFPSEFLDIKKVDEAYISEYEAVCKIPEFKVMLYNYEELVSGGTIKIYSSEKHTGNCIYRGWMLKPEQYKLLYDSLKSKNIYLINSPDEYNTCHMFPYAYKYINKSDTPKILYYYGNECLGRISWDLLNKTFNRFMIKDYVKSINEKDYPVFFETPVNVKEMINRFYEFFEYRDGLFTGGIVFKEYVDFNKYGDVTNEYRAFYLKNKLLSLCLNSNQPEINNPVPVDFVNKYSCLPSNYYTVDFGELADGRWIVIETGDGQVSGLSPNQNVFKYYYNIRRTIFE